MGGGWTLANMIAITTQTNVASLSLTAGVYVITGYFQLQSSGQYHNYINKVVMNFSDNSAANPVEPWTNSNITPPLITRQQTYPKFDTGLGNQELIFHDTLSQTVQIKNTSTIYFNIGVNSDNVGGQTIQIINGRLTATRIA